MADKGEGFTSRNGACFVKLVARFDDSREMVRVTSIGIQSAGNSSVDGAKGIDSSLNLYDFEEERVQLVSGGTDAGGGATREDLGLKLNERQRVENIGEYIASTCSLHGMNLTLASPTSLTMGDGGFHKRTVMQLLHTAYNLSQQYRTEEWYKLWTKVTETECTQVKCPVMTI